MFNFSNITIAGLWKCILEYINSVEKEWLLVKIMILIRVFIAIMTTRISEEDRRMDELTRKKQNRTCSVIALLLMGATISLVNARKKWINSHDWQEGPTESEDYECSWQLTATTINVTPDHDDDYSKILLIFVICELLSLFLCVKNKSILLLLALSHI